MGASAAKQQQQNVYDNIEYLDKLRAPEQSCFVTKMNPHLQLIKVECGRNMQEVREEWLVSLGRFKSMTRWNLQWKDPDARMDQSWRVGADYRDESFFEEPECKRFMHMPLDQFLYQQDQFWRRK